MKNKVFSIILLTVALFLHIGTNDGITQQALQLSDSSLEVNVDIEAETQRALEAIKAFAGSLQAELKQALNAGGPTKAISVCNTQANVIAKDISLQRNLTIQRVSLKNRNPDNAPMPWQKKVLEDFEEKKLKGIPLSELSHSEVVQIGPLKQFRFMKAIPTGKICVQCHGTDLSDDVKYRLDQLYPEDKARGFQPGDIRGAFVVTRDLSS